MVSNTNLKKIEVAAVLLTAFALVAVAVIPAQPVKAMQSGPCYADGSIPYCIRPGTCTQSNYCQVTCVFGFSFYAGGYMPYSTSGGLEYCY